MKLLGFCKPFSVVLQKLRQEEIKLWSNKNLENLNIDLEFRVGTSSENISENYVTSVEEESLLKRYLTTLNSQIRSGNLFAYDAVTKQLICQAKGPEVNLLSEHAQNIVHVNRTYSCETEQSEKFTLVDIASSVQNNNFLRVSDDLALSSSSLNEGSVCSTPEPFLPQSVVTLLEPDTEDGQIDTSDFCMTHEIASQPTEFDESSLYIPEAYTVELYPVCLHSEEIVPALANIQQTCEYPKSRLISYFLPQSLKSVPFATVGHQSKPGFECSTPRSKKLQQSFPLIVSDTSMYSPQLYPEILNPLLPLESVTPAIHTGLSQKSTMEADSTSYDYSVIVNELEEQKIIGEQDSEDRLLSPPDSLQDKHTVNGVNILPVSHTAEKLDVYQNVEQTTSLADLHFTQQTMRRSVSLNCEHENPACTSTIRNRETVPSPVGTPLCDGGSFRNELVSNNESCFSSICEPELLYGSVTYANTSQTRSGFVVRGNKMYHNCTETSEAQCEQSLLFKSAPAATSLCAKESVKTSIMIEKMFPKKCKKTVLKANQNMEKLSREVRKLMKDECVSIRDKQFFKILNCDCKVLRKREIRRRCTNRVKKVEGDIIKPCRAKCFKAYKYISTCKPRKEVNDSVCLDVVNSVNSKEHLEVPVTTEIKSDNYPNEMMEGITKQLFTENSTSINVNHKIQNSLSMHYELQSVERNSVELKLKSSDSARGSCFQHCGELKSFHQYSLTSVINGPEHTTNHSEHSNAENITLRPYDKPDSFSSLVSSIDPNSGDTPKLQEVVSAVGRLEQGNLHRTCQMRLRSQSQSNETVLFACTSEKTHRLTHKTVRSDSKCFVSVEKHRSQKKKIIKNLNQQINLRKQFTDMYHIMLQGPSRTQSPENEEFCGYVQFCSSSKLRIFRKRQILGRQKKKAISRELQQLLQDECKELVNLGLERTNVPAKETSKSSPVEISRISQLKEVEEDHREWFKNEEVMCVINFPYEFRSI